MLIPYNVQILLKIYRYVQQSVAPPFFTGFPKIGTGIERHGGWQLASELLPSFPRYHMVRQNYTRRKREDRQSSSPESVKPPPKAAKSLTDTNEDESVMAASSTEEANISLEDIKETLDSIQATIEKVLFENGQVKTELKELKASLKAKDREVKNLQESLSKTRETNQLLKAELEAAKTKIKKQEEETYNLWDSLDSLEQYTRKNSLEIIGIPAECESTEEAVLKVANALEVDIDSSSIEISHRIRRKKNDNALIVKFVNHKDKTKLYKARAKLKSVKMTSLFPNSPAVPPEKDRIFINENLTDHRRYVMGQANKMKRDGLLHSFWSMDGKIFVKTSPQGNPTRIFSVHDLDNL